MAKNEPKTDPKADPEADADNWDKDEADAGAAPPTNSGKRPVEQIRKDLDKARAELHDMMPQVEGDTTKIRNQAGRIEAAKTQWKMDHPDEPFDPEVAGVNLRPFKGNADLQKQFHKQHYVIARLEKELENADPAL